MAPGKRHRLDISTSGPNTALRVGEEPHRPNVRGPTRGARVESVIDGRDGQRISVEIEDVVNIPARHASQLSSDIGFIVRSHANIGAPSFMKMSKDERDSLYEHLQVHFDVDLSCPKMFAYVKATFSHCFADFRTELRKHFDLFPTLEEAKRNPPKGMSGARAPMWEQVCDVFDSPIFKKRSAAGKKARAANKNDHRGGSKRFQSRTIERAKERALEGVDQVDPIEIYKETHYSATKGWIQTSREKYEKMIEVRSESTSEGSQPLSDVEVMSQVLGEKSRYYCGMGYGRKPSKGSSADLESIFRRQLEKKDKEMAEREVKLKEEMKEEMKAEMKAELEKKDKEFEVKLKEQLEQLKTYIFQLPSGQSSNSFNWSPPPPPPPVV